MPKKKSKIIDDNFIMSPKYDFVFKYIFGNEKHKDLLIALLSDILVRHVKKNNKSVFLYFSNYTASANVANTRVLTTFTSLSNSKNPKNL